jgi:nucleotide-binding universal stress UspA family protein
MVAEGESKEPSDLRVRCSGIDSSVFRGIYWRAIMDSLKNVVVGVDFSDSSRSALSVAMRVAAWNEAKLHAVHVVDTSILGRLAGAYSDRALLESKDTRLRMRDASLIQLQELVDGKAPRGGSVSLEALMGKPFVEILRLIGEKSEDLLVLGVNGSSDSARGAGRLATKCIRRAVCKMLLAQNSNVGCFKKIVACVDFSDNARHVVEQAVRIARQDRSEVHLLHVFSRPRYAPSRSDSMQQHASEVRRQCKEHFDTCFRECIEPYDHETIALSIEPHLLRNASPAQGILEFLNTSDADLVVLGAHHRTGLKALFMQTLAERIVRYSGCSVLVASPGDFRHNVD